MEQLSKYIEDKNFILWVFQPDKELEAWWRQFDIDHPEEKRHILLARKVLQKFRTTNKTLSEEEKILLFSKVLKQIEEKKLSGKTRRIIIGFMRYAAVALLFFSIGVMLFYKQDHFNPQFYAQKIAEPIPKNSAVLIRASGEDILLKENKSILQHQADGKLVINSDTISSGVSSPATIAAMNQLIIPYGKTSEVLLPDGTRVFLNAGSRLVYPEFFTGKTREVFLAGEAFFDVKHDQSNPFIVQLSDLRVKVLGTRFNISAYGDDNVIETVLAEGKVHLELNNAGFFDKRTELVTNQLASFDRRTLKTNITTVNSEQYILWTRGIFQFESTDLNRVTSRLERFYNIQFKYIDPFLGGLRISGKLELNEDKDEICDRIALAASVRIIKKAEGIYEILK